MNAFPSAPAPSSLSLVGGQFGILRFTAAPSRARLPFYFCPSSFLKNRADNTIAGRLSTSSAGLPQIHPLETAVGDAFYLSMFGSRDKEAYGA
jgi:hypothetical protein